MCSLGPIGRPAELLGFRAGCSKHLSQLCLKSFVVILQLITSPTNCVRGNLMMQAAFRKSAPQ